MSVHCSSPGQESRGSYQLGNFASKVMLWHLRQDESLGSMIPVPLAQAPKHLSNQSIVWAIHAWQKGTMFLVAAIANPGKWLDLQLVSNPPTPLLLATHLEKARWEKKVPVMRLYLVQVTLLSLAMMIPAGSLGHVHCACGWGSWLAFSHQCQDLNSGHHASTASSLAILRGGLGFALCFVLYGSWDGWRAKISQSTPLSIYTPS